MEHERFEGERTLMRIYIGESDKWHGKQRVLPTLDEMIGGGLITLEKVRVILYRAHK
jgi:PII-like signaling protein